MKIAIDVSQIVYGTGVAVYTRKLVENLLAIDKENEYVLFGGSLRRRGELRDFGARTFPIPPRAADFIWNRLHILPIECLAGKIDVYHSSDWAQAPAKAFKVTTVHDLAPLKFPKQVDPLIVAVHNRRLGWVKKEVDRVIVPSLQTKDDLVAYGIPADKIRMIPEAAVNSPVSPKDVESVKRKYGVNTKYLLAVGITPLKNTERIIRAFDLVGGRDLKLVLVGRPSNFKIEERRGMRITGFVSEAELAALYTGAEALVFPSLYEGFGIPILDGFACGTPVVTSNVSCLPEVAGDAAVLVDPFLVDSIAEGIKFALKNRRGLIAKGLKRVKAFSWAKCAQETLGVYQEAKKPC